MGDAMTDTGADHKPPPAIAALVARLHQQRLSSASPATRARAIAEQAERVKAVEPAKVEPVRVTAPTDPHQSLRLEEAKRIAFPDGSISVASLRRELGARGLMHRVANKDFTTLADIEELKRSCRVQAKGRISTSSKPKAAQRSGTSATDSDPGALDALKAKARKLRESLPRTSSKSTTPEQGSAEVIRMPSR
jgi:hypothetical protein